MKKTPGPGIRDLLLTCLLVSAASYFNEGTDRAERDSEPTGTGCSSLQLNNLGYSVFGKNLTNERYLMSFLDVGANVVATSPTDVTPVYAPGLWSFGTPNRPRYFGAELQVKF